MQKINEKDCLFRFGDSGPKYIFRGPNIDWGIILFKPNQSMGLHYHRKVEETYYVFSGSPKLIINNKEYRAIVGDAFRIEPSETHDIINDTDQDIKVVMIKYPYLPEDKVDVR